MSSAAFLSPVFFLLLTISFHLFAAQSEVLDSTGYGKDSLCPVPNDGNMACPINCFRYEPVCGENGVTYGCGCLDAACAGVRVVKIGPCELSSGAPSAAVSSEADAPSPTN
ncbi:uncharacterized protein LOC110110596 [Dendrobium catenatum]|uniref:uncharacterized protein LOC110110596 n=1 Tax=Dendrobium catenatum TaxID=906689 RepID=UPI0009F26E11|nr:uncharacterized protein LOC110110596 [Dendrobium catenatum]